FPIMILMSLVHRISILPLPLSLTGLLELDLVLGYKSLHLYHQLLDQVSMMTISVVTNLITMFIYMVYYIDRILYVKPSLHLWDKAYLVMVNNVFDVFLESVCRYFIEYFCIYVHEGNCCYISNFISDFINLDALSLTFEKVPWGAEKKQKDGSCFHINSVNMCLFIDMDTLLKTEHGTFSFNSNTGESELGDFTITGTQDYKTRNPYGLFTGTSPSSQIMSLFCPK
ncbi:hypothetical protein STEG23_016363, partial [Scotinomys teguina]